MSLCACACVSLCVCVRECVFVCVFVMKPNITREPKSSALIVKSAESYMKYALTHIL